MGGWRGKKQKLRHKNLKKYWLSKINSGPLQAQGAGKVTHLKRVSCLWLLCYRIKSNQIQWLPLCRVTEHSRRSSNPNYLN